MIISFSKKFIFIRPKRISGENLEYSLANSCNKEDIISYSRNDSILAKHSKNFYHYPVIKDTKYILKRFLTLNLLNQNKVFDFKHKFYCHMPFKDIIKSCYYKKFDLNDFKIFTCVRNPYEQMLSIYFQSKKYGSINFENYVIDNSLKYFNKIKKIIEPPKNVTYNFILRYENIEDDLLKAEKILDIKILKYYTKSNLNQSPKYNSQEYLTDKVKNLIYQNSKYYFDLFNYKK